jgi:hypothetical protein
MKALLFAVLVLGAATFMGCRAEGEIDTATNVGLAR